MQSTPLRILLMPSAYYPHVGGIEETTRQLALTFQESGHEVSVLTNLWPAGVVAKEQLDGVDVVRQSFPMPAARAANAARFVIGAPSAALSLVTYVRRLRPDVIHVIGAGPQAAYTAALATFLNTRIVFTGQGELTFDARGAFEQSTTLRHGLRRMLRRADEVTACSAYVLETLRGFGEISGRAQVIPNGVNPHDFDQPATREDRFGRYVLAVGRLVPQKGFDTLLDAYAMVADDDLALVIAGTGMERYRLEAKVAKLGMTQRVHLLGAVDRASVARLLGSAEMFAFPSRVEPFGIALLEAMAAGVPAVATEAGGVPEFAHDNVNALLVPVDDVSALAAALSRLRDDRQLRARLTAEGRKTAGQLTWRSIGARFEAVYVGTSATSK